MGMQAANRCFLSAGGLPLAAISRALRWPSTQVAANWSGGRWRADSFLSQGSDYKLPWSAMSSSSPVVTMITTSSPGTQSQSPGSKLETLLWREPAMQLSPFQLHLLNVNL